MRKNCFGVHRVKGEAAASADNRVEKYMIRRFSTQKMNEPQTICRRCGEVKPYLLYRVRRDGGAHDVVRLEDGK